jgi:hypothetical protein
MPLSTTSEMALKPTQAPEKRRQRPAVEAELQVLGHVGRVHQRHAPGLQRLVALVRRAAGHAAVVVAADHQHAALRGRAVDVAVLERVARAVHARPLAVPHREHAIDGALRVSATRCTPSRRWRPGLR